MDRAGLLEQLHLPSKEAARQALAGKTTIEEGADSLIKIQVKDVNAVRATQIANAYLDSLQDLNEHLALTESARTRKFFEQQLEHERSLLGDAEVGLAKTQKSTGVLDPSAQTQLGLGSVQAIRSQITALQVQLAGLLQRETEQGPDVQSTRSQIKQLEAEEHALESNSGANTGAAPAVDMMPDKNLSYQRAMRDVREHETIVQSLATQFETARLTEAEGHSAFEVVDRAVVPEHRAWPPRKQLILLALVLGWILGLAGICVKLLVRRVLGDPQSRNHLEWLRANL
ncbi:MAG: GNVR domain-containing protein [Acidobacteriaceae bacterium]|nr:GNVR domain-containing protein [Acidobacteriaceae bacterium]